MTLEKCHIQSDKHITVTIGGGYCINHCEFNPLKGCIACSKIKEAKNKTI